MTVTQAQAQMLTDLARACRPHGASRWDAAGVMAAIKQVADRGLPEVVMAVIRAASDRDVDTPGVIPKPGTHWAETTTVASYVPRPHDRANTCGTCSLTQEKCRARWAGDHDYEPLERAMARKGAVDIGRTIQALKADMPPPPPVAEPTTTRTPHGPECVRAAGHTGPCLPPTSEPQEAT